MSWLIRRGAMLAALSVAALPGHGLAQTAVGGLVPYTVERDAVVAPLAGRRGEARAGKAVILDPERGNCGICHELPGSRPRTQGDIGPSLAGVAGRLSEGQIRLRVIDGTRLNPATVMPSYYRIEGLRRVSEKYAGKPVLTAAEVEDVVAFLMTLGKEP